MHTQAYTCAYKHTYACEFVAYKCNIHTVYIRVCIYMYSHIYIYIYIYIYSQLSVSRTSR